MRPASRGTRPRIDGVPEQRRADADHRRVSTSTGRYASDRGPGHVSGIAGGAGPRLPPSRVRMVLVVVAVLITVTAVSGALFRADADSTAPATSTTGALRSTASVAARLAGAETSTASGETRWLTMRDDHASSSQTSGPGPVVVPEKGPGEFRIARAPRPESPHGGFTYTVEVEENLPFAADQVARLVDATLADPRSWSTDTRPLVRVDRAPTARVLLASPETADALCAPLETRGRLSCRNGANVVLNAWRWVNGSPDFPRLLNYRRYVINHEVGHALGYAHQPCPSPGAPAPVMLQQSLGLDGCRPNPWPEPSA